MKSDIHFVMKTWSACILLAVAVTMMPVGSFPARESIQNNSVQHLVNNSAGTVMVTRIATQPAETKANISALVDMPVILKNPPSWGTTSILTVWNVKFQNGTNCHLSYMGAKNISETNCSENINWLSRPDQEYALHIRPLHIFNEGIYKCSHSVELGTFSHEYALTVLVPPWVLLTFDQNGTAVCTAAAGKPAAEISWGPKGNFSTVHKTLPNGTETVKSTYNITKAQENNLVCNISHPAWNNSRVLSLRSGRNGENLQGSKMPILYALITVFLGVILILFFVYIGKLLYRKQSEVDTSKTPETMSRHSIQEEMEPYATFVQMENVIYDKTFGTSVGKPFPSGLSPST